MGKQRKTWSAEVKESIVPTVLRGDVSVAEAAQQHGANESLIHTWKTNFLDGGRSRLAGERQDNGHAALERENDRLNRIVAVCHWLTACAGSITCSTCSHASCWQVKQLGAYPCS